MYHPRLKGTHYEMGQHYASIIYKNGFRISQLPKLTGKAIDFGKKSEIIVKKFYPEILEEVKGFADGCKGSYDFLVSFLLNIGIDEFGAPKCSVFAVNNGSNVIFGRNHDFYPEFKKTTESVLVSPQNGYKFIGQSDAFIGKIDGLNEKGLAIGMSFVLGKIIKPGISFEFAGRYVLEKCGTVEEAKKTLLNMEFATSQNFLIADKKGNMAVIEASPQKVKVREPERGDNFVIATNNFRIPEMKGFEKEHDRNWFNSETRFNTISDSLKNMCKTVDMSVAQEILSGKYGFVCQYDKGTKIDTLWSVVMNLNKSIFYRAEGNPSITEYKEDTRLDRVIKRNVK